MKMAMHGREWRLTVSVTADIAIRDHASTEDAYAFACSITDAAKRAHDDRGQRFWQDVAREIEKRDRTAAKIP